MKILFMLIVAHALCDYALQNDLMANAKNRFKPHQIHSYVPWFYWLASHSLIHGGAVAHFFIDDRKCAGWIGIHRDQAFHILCKVLWVLILTLI